MLNGNAVKYIVVLFQKSQGALLKQGCDPIINDGVFVRVDIITILIYLVEEYDCEELVDYETSVNACLSRIPY